jgi:gliding motility-associated-like protein
MDITKKIAMMNRLIKTIIIALGILIFPIVGYCQYQTIPDPAFRQFLITNYPKIMNNYGQLDVQAASTIQGSMNCPSLGIKDLTGIEYFRYLTSINCSNNNLSFIPSLLSLTYLISLDCSNNQLMALPPMNWSGQTIKKINCSHNHLTNLIEYFYSTTLDSLICNNNELTFEDLLPAVNKGYKQFIYAPQSSVEMMPNLSISIGDTIHFYFPADDTVSSNTYTVVKDGKPIYPVSGAPYMKNTFEIPITDYSKLGNYQIVVTNKYLPQLTIKTGTFLVEAENKNQEVFTPNGDDKDDSYLVNCSGTIRIYNKYGQQIKQLEGSNYWDGTDQQGLEVPIGTYIIRCNDSDEKVVTVLK